MSSRSEFVWAESKTQCSADTTRRLIKNAWETIAVRRATNVCSFPMDCPSLEKHMFSEVVSVCELSQ